MISKLYVKNFRSIAEATIDFSFAEKKAPNGYEQMERMPFIEDGKTRCAPIVAIFGSNASGKTNILGALSAVLRLMSGNYDLSERRWFFEPNMIVDSGDETIFRIDYSISGHACQYEIRIAKEGIRLEIFTCDGKEIFKVENGSNIHFDTSVELPSKDYNPEMFAKALNAECTDGNGHFFYSFASLVFRRFKGLNDLFNRCIFYFAYSISIMNSSSKSIYFELPMQIQKIGDFTGETYESILHEITRIIRKLDVDILDIKIKKDLMDNEGGKFQKNCASPFNQYQVYSFHKNKNGGNVVFNFLYHESDGTIRLAEIIAYCLFALKSGGVLIIDELDSSLHPFLVEEIINLFAMRYNNHKEAQLIFTSHQVNLLDDDILRPSEFVIVDKNRQEGTGAMRLSDYRNEGDNVRNVSKFRKLYLNGFYPGAPKTSL